MVERILSSGITGDLWVDGSFITQKIEPGDIDIVLNLDSGFLAQATPTQMASLHWLGTTDATVRAQMKHDYSCDAYAFCDIPAGQPGHPGIDLRQYWLNQFGIDRSGASKGIAVLSVLGGVL